MEYKQPKHLNDSCVLYKLRFEEYGSVNRYYSKLNELEKKINNIEGYDLYLNDGLNEALLLLIYIRRNSDTPLKSMEQLKW